jgi:CubicO group peptidase (beta-lactamase class C family)
MSDQPRPLPGRPSLRYLKLEARRRLAAGEFDALHDAQLAIAREHGQPSWNALRQLIETRLAEPGHPALTHLRWVVSRFGGAGGRDWAAPSDDELREHFTDDYVRQVTARKIVQPHIAYHLYEELVVLRDEPLRARARAGGMRLEARAEPGPPHRLSAFRIDGPPAVSQVTDARAAEPPTVSSGTVPATAAEAAVRGLRVGLPGVVLAGGTPDGARWVLARGRANLARAEPMRPDHRFPVYGITRLVTAIAVLRLVAEDRMGLDDAANDHLRTVRLADDAVTIRELLSYSGGVDDPAPGNGYADSVPALASLYGGPVLPCSGPRGTMAGSSRHGGGYAALGQLIADVTGLDYATAVGRLVLGPLGMISSTFPASWPHEDPDAVTGYELGPGGTFVPDVDEVAAMPAAAGLWTTAADLVSFGTGWSALLPGDLAADALRPQADTASGSGQAGLGWRVVPSRGFTFEKGSGPGASAFLVAGLSDGRACVALANREERVGTLALRAFLAGA